MPVRWWAELAWLGDRVARGVLLEADGGRFTAITPGVPAPGQAVRLPGLTLPGLANTHSHAFHRALRGRTHGEHGTFWTWRERMYEVAQRLTPDSYRALARAVYAEMALAGVTCVGEFHYLHHAPGGRPYGPGGGGPNAMGDALLVAAVEAGIRLTLLDTCYLSGNIGEPLRGPQLRFGDVSAEDWAARVSGLRLPPQTRLGAGLHSVRAVPRAEMTPVVEWARERGAPLHVHVSEQRVENDACAEAYGVTPAELLDEAGVLGPATTAVHATHLAVDDLALLGDSGTGACVCPTTERDLADGCGPFRALADAGASLSLGSDSHAVIDLFEEARAVELGERVHTERRGHFRPSELLHAATSAGHAALGWPESGWLVPGAPADFCTVATDTPRLAGVRPDTAVELAVFAATAADVRQVFVGGRQIVEGGRHVLVGDVAAALDAALREVAPA
ncbi:MAG: formimidoylglutamate deiminase [Carbonactinosporaceae bacterium]